MPRRAPQNLGKVQLQPTPRVRANVAPSAGALGGISARGLGDFAQNVGQAGQTVTRLGAKLQDDQDTISLMEASEEAQKRLRELMFRTGAVPGGLGLAGGPPDGYLTLSGSQVAGSTQTAEAEFKKVQAEIEKTLRPGLRDKFGAIFHSYSESNINALFKHELAETEKAKIQGFQNQIQSVMSTLAVDPSNGNAQAVIERVSVLSGGLGYGPEQQEKVIKALTSDVYETQIRSLLSNGTPGGATMASKILEEHSEDIEADTFINLQSSIEDEMVKEEGSGAAEAAMQAFPGDPNSQEEYILGAGLGVEAQDNAIERVRAEERVQRQRRLYSETDSVMAADRWMEVNPGVTPDDLPYDMKEALRQTGTFTDWKIDWVRRAYALDGDGKPSADADVAASSYSARDSLMQLDGALFGMNPGIDSRLNAFAQMTTDELSAAIPYVTNAERLAVIAHQKQVRADMGIGKTFNAKKKAAADVVNDVIDSMKGQGLIKKGFEADVALDAMAYYDRGVVDGKPPSEKDLREYVDALGRQYLFNKPSLIRTLTGGLLGPQEHIPGSSLSGQFAENIPVLEQAYKKKYGNDTVLPREDIIVRALLAASRNGKTSFSDILEAVWKESNTVNVLEKFQKDLGSSRRSNFGFGGQ